MTDAEYAEVLETARTDIKKRKPDISGSDLEKQAQACADGKRQQRAFRYQSSASSTFEWKKP